MKIIAKNRRAKFDYEITETLVAGIALSGGEVKSIKQGHISLKGAYVTVSDNELYLLNAHVSPYKFAGEQTQAETRTRKLLVHRKELDRLIGLKKSGQALIPMAVGLQRGLVKVEVGVGRGKKKYDKRETAKKRQAERDIARKLSAKH